MAHSINRQLGIGIAPSELFPTKYTLGLKTSNPQLATEDWSLDFYNDIGFSDATGEETWSNSYGRESCRAKCTQYFPSGAEKYLKKACDKTCKTECTRKKKCPPKGDTPYPTKESVLQRAGLGTTPTPNEIKSAELNDVANVNPQQAGFGGNKTLMIVGGVVVLGIIVTLLIKRRKK